MSEIGDNERTTQNRIVALLRDEAGYRYLGKWHNRAGNSNIEEEILRESLMGRGYSEAQCTRAIAILLNEANKPTRTLYENNKAVYELLYHGVKVKTSAEEEYKTVWLIDWDNVDHNDFAFAEEVTLNGDHERRPDIVLYVNGLAFCVLELKSSTAAVETGIRQNLSNQQPEFHAWFFSTVQLVFAGNNTQGLRYGTVLTPERFFMSWKEDEQDDTRYKLDKYLLKMCEPSRLLELIHDYTVFDNGVRKAPRHSQYFAAQAARKNVKEYRGGVIWDTMGSGKSLIMEYLAQYILRTNPNARVLIVTDREELDHQISGVFSGAGVSVAKPASGAELLAVLASWKDRVICSLVHKFGYRDVGEFDTLIGQLPVSASPVVGELFVFVDECHRTQTGKLHKAMTRVLPNATFIGFTGTPLLKKDVVTTKSTFGEYIHTYKFIEAVADGVVLDFAYEGRDIEQLVNDPTEVDRQFELRTQGLSEWQRLALRKRWGTYQMVRSSVGRAAEVVNDIMLDFATRPELMGPNNVGNAMLVASSIYEATKYYDLFQSTSLKGAVALVVSYDPQENVSEITLEETGMHTATEKQFVYTVHTEMLRDQKVHPNKSRAESYREDIREVFVKYPARVKLLIVVNMCLTGFDPPDCAYIYLDRELQDHGLLQAISRSNRVSGPWKQYGTIIDYKDLFTHIGDVIAVYNSELDTSDGGVSPAITVRDRLVEGRKRFDLALEVAEGVCEKVAPPKNELTYIHYFCGNIEVADDLVSTKPLRDGLYRAIDRVIRTYTTIADNLAGAGFSVAEAQNVCTRVTYFTKLRDTIKNAAGEKIDQKAYEADMRELIDNFIEASAPTRAADFEGMGLLEILELTGALDAVNSLPAAIQASDAAVAETIVNNVRAKIVERHLTDPAYYGKMSTLLAEIIASLRSEQVAYKEFMKEIVALATRVTAGSDAATPPVLKTKGVVALYNNLTGSEDECVALALDLDAAVRGARQADWRGNKAKSNLVKRALDNVVHDEDEVERIFAILVQQSEY
jgi:type I restriction enzyme R subunit